MTFGKMGTDREERINYERMRKYRLARTKEQMEKHGIGCLVSWDAFDIRYISGQYITVPGRWTEGQCCILPRNGDPFVHSSTCFNFHAMQESIPWLKGRIGPFLGIPKMATTINEVSPLVDEVARIMAEHGLTKEPLGLDCTTSELLLQEAFAEKGIKVVDAKHAMFEARKIKSKDEIECVRMACSNAEAAFSDIQNAIRPGISEGELMGIGMKTLYTLGADEAMEFVCASGPRTNPLWIDYTDRQIRPGDLVVIDINANSFQGYKTCYYRTFCCGKANEEQKEAFDKCHDILWDAINVIKAGKTSHEVLSKWPDSPNYWGYDKWEDVIAFAAAHGVGISLHEAPFFSVMWRGEPIKLEEGMVIALETWAGRRGGEHGVRLEDMVAVTKDGYDLLTKYPAHHLIECWM